MTMTCLKAIVFAFAALSVTGCVSTMRGTPDRPFSSTLVTDEAAIKNAVVTLSNGSLDSSDANIVARRNQNISTLLSAVDANYFEFRKNIFANSRHSSAGTGSLTLLMTIAGGLTGSAGVKQHYLLGTNLVNGVSTQFQKSYLYEKNVGSLVATMDADRDEILKGILVAIDEGEYRGQLALLDVYKYFVAGTLENAVVSLEKKATEQAGKSAADVRDIQLLRSQRALQRQDALRSFQQSTPK